ncbi:hypothetical protein TNIN_163411, partial [Trichonephila inaurata madagascariensis]
IGQNDYCPELHGRDDGGQMELRVRVLISLICFGE